MKTRDKVVAVLVTLGVLAIMLMALLEPKAGKTYDILMDTEIGDPNTVRTELGILRDAQKGDVINIHISGPGGQVDTVFLLINAVKASKAYVRMIVEAPSYSGDAYLATVGNELVMRPYSFLMFHTSSMYGLDCTAMAGTDRTVPNSEHCQAFMKTHLGEVEKFLDNVPFLLEDEKAAIKTGHDIYITSEELNNRKAGKATSQVVLPILIIDPSSIRIVKAVGK